ncbi:MAG TPA: methyl-accepting chemotaxis protein, partial [Lachnospiraceae bacterium]|nr:methyl-accepting chemotaxis protein [Lachnospiraceae bacterium]
RSIEGIVVLMNEIAEQTSLLSLNASIEAARAGEAGRGFAVVAEEIRKLADQSQQSANRIGSIVSSIHGQTQSIVHTTKRAKQIVLSQGDSLRDTIKVFHSMNQNVEQLSGNLETIGTGVEGVELAKEGTLHAIENISAVSEETAAASEQVIRIADSQLIVAEQLNGYAEALGENTKRLEEAIGIFHV